MNFFSQRKWLKTAVAGLVVVNLFFLGVLLFGQKPASDEEKVEIRKPGGNAGSPHQRRAGKFLKSELNLNEHQIKAFHADQQKHFAYRDSVQDLSRKLRVKLLKLLEQEAADPAEAERLAMEIGQLKVHLELEIYRHFGALRDMLEADQLAKFKELIGDVAERLGPPPGGPHHRGPHHGPSGSPISPGGPPGLNGPPPGRNGPSGHSGPLHGRKPPER